MAERRLDIQVPTKFNANDVSTYRIKNSSGRLVYRGESTTVDKVRSDEAELDSVKRDLKINNSWQVAKES